MRVRGARGSQCVCKGGQGSQCARERPSKKQSLHFMLRCSHVTEGQLAHTHSVTGSLPRWKPRLTSSYDTGMNSLVNSTDVLQAHAPQQESALLNLHGRNPEPTAHGRDPEPCALKTLRC